jgi:RNA recognition motif-containing protein
LITRFLLPFQKRFCKLSVVLILLLVTICPESFIHLFIFIIFIMNIYVGNLNYRVKEGDLQQVMEDYGAVSSVKVVMDRETGKSKGFAFIEMEDDAAAAKAIAELNGAEYMGRTMVVKEARPRA